MKPTGYIIYQGPSKLDGAPIVVIALTGSTNRKTGNMVQTYILRSDVDPVSAVRSGADASICGDCKHRGDGAGNGRSCYVTLVHGPRSVYATYLRGKYPHSNWSVGQTAELARGRNVRLGTYGDPAAVPVAVWQELLKHATGHTGYTHAWRTVDMQELVMASADTAQEAESAKAIGYRTFRVMLQGETLAHRESICPASEEAGRKTTCNACRACAGSDGKRGTIAIYAHGNGKAYAQANAVQGMR